LFKKQYRLFDTGDIAESNKFCLLRTTIYRFRLDSLPLEHFEYVEYNENWVPWSIKEKKEEADKEFSMRIYKAMGYSDITISE